MDLDFKYIHNPENSYFSYLKIFNNLNNWNVILTLWFIVNNSPESKFPMKVYETLHRIGIKKSYSFKFLFIAFIGTHIPLIGMVLFSILAPSQNYDSMTTLLWILAYTLVAAVVTLYLLDRILAPIKLASKMVTTYAATGKLLKVPKVFTDEAGILLKQLDSMFTKMEHMTMERKSFTGLLAHDIRNPIANIKGLANVMEDIVKEPSVLECIAMVHKSCDSCLEIITDVTSLLKADDFSLDNGSMKSVNVLEFLNVQVERLEIPLARKNMDVQLNIASDDTLMVSPEFFSHIVQNLVTNAIKFSHSKGIIEIHGSIKNNYYSLSIRDYGIGFESEQADKLFQSFTPLGREGTHKEPSSGLGLFLTKMLVEKHNGRIEGFSEGDGKGAVFTISIPYRQD